MSFANSSSPTRSPRLMLNDMASLRAHLKQVQEQRDSMAERAKQAEGHVAELLRVREASEALRAKTAEQLAVAQTERSGLSQSSVRLERQLAEMTADRDSQKVQVASLESRCQKLQEQRDQSEAQRADLHEKCMTVAAEKKLLDKAVRRSDTEGAEWRAAADARAKELEARCGALAEQCEGARRERAAAKEALLVAQAERRLVEEAAARSEEASRMHKEAAQARIDTSEG